MNVAKNPFDSTPNCGGGLFFSDAKNILEFCNYGNLIAEVEVPEGELVVPVDTKYKSHSIIEVISRTLMERPDNVNVGLYAERIHNAVNSIQNFLTVGETWD